MPNDLTGLGGEAPTETVFISCPSSKSRGHDQELRQKDAESNITPHAAAA